MKKKTEQAVMVANGVSESCVVFTVSISEHAKGIVQSFPEKRTLDLEKIARDSMRKFRAQHFNREHA